jgi:hypothetical protein
MPLRAFAPPKNNPLHHAVLLPLAAGLPRTCTGLRPSVPRSAGAEWNAADREPLFCRQAGGKEGTFTARSRAVATTDSCSAGRGQQGTAVALWPESVEK